MIEQMDSKVIIFLETCQNLNSSPEVHRRAKHVLFSDFLHTTRK